MIIHPWYLAIGLWCLTRPVGKVARPKDDINKTIAIVLMNIIEQAAGIYLIVKSIGVA